MTAITELVEIFTDISDKEIMEKLFQEIFTEKELKDVSLRWELLKELHEGFTQRKIASNHRISLCKITRGSKILKDDNSIIKKILIDKLGEQKKRK